jgi:hypothetical protein
VASEFGTSLLAGLSRYSFGKYPVRIPLDVARGSELISPTIPI